MSRTTVNDKGRAALARHDGVLDVIAPRMHARRQRQSGPDVALVLGLTWAVVFSFLAWLATISVMANQGVANAVAVIGFIVVPALGLWCVAKAGSHGGRYLLVLVTLIILISDVSVRGRSQGLDAQSAAKFALWFSGLLLLPWHANLLNIARRDLPTFVLLLFGVLALASTIYSITPVYTLAAALAFLGLWMSAVLLATSIDAGRALLWILWSLLAMSSASLLLYLVAPGIAMVAYESGSILRLGGIFGNANVLGAIAALAMLLTFLGWYYLSKRTSAVLTILAVPICGACLVLTQSRTSILALTAGVSVVLLRRYPLLLFPTVLIGSATVTLIYTNPAAIDTLIALVARSGRITQVTTFTGRTEIWQFVMSAIEKAPLFGHGFASTKELIPAGYAGRYGWTTASAHNLWLQAWVTTGAIGLLLILISQLGVLKALVQRPLPLRDGVCAFVLFGGLFESGPVGPSVSMITFVWIWATALSLRQRQPNSDLTKENLYSQNFDKRLPQLKS